MVAACLAAAFAEPNPWQNRKFHPLALAERGHDLTCEKLEDGSWVIRTTGTDPYLRITNLTEKINPRTAYRVMFQYQATAESDVFQVLYETHTGLKHLNQQLPVSEQWRWHAFELADGEAGIGEVIDWLRFDFGNEAGKVFRIRDLRLIRKLPEFDPGSIEHLPFELRKDGNQIEVSPLPDAGWEITSTGEDPYVMARGLAESFQPDVPYLIAFEYQAPPESEPVSMYYHTESGVQHDTLQTKPADDWTWHLHDFSVDGRGREEALKWLRFDFGSEPDVTYRIRNCRLIPATLVLRQRAELGDQFDQLKWFGIDLNGVAPQTSAIETVRHADDQSIAVTVSAYRHLDLDAETKRVSEEPSAKPPVPLAPRIVAGEGEHPDNHTVVRVLSPYQVCETQFLAFPPEVRGGVGLETGTDSAGETFIAAYPLRSTRSQELRLFSTSGGLRGAIGLPDDLLPPFTAAVGDYLPEHDGDEIAVASRFSSSSPSSVLVFSAAGESLASLPIPGETDADYRQEFDLFTKGGKTLVVQNLALKHGYRLLPNQDPKPIDFHQSPAGSRLFDALYNDRDFNLGGPEALVSTLHPWKDGQQLEASLDVGRMENIFWFDPQEVHNGSHATWGTFPDGNYVKNSLYNFLGAAQYWSPLVKSGEIEDRSYEEWVDGIDWERQAFSHAHRKSTKEYNEGVPTVWNACFTHRWSIGASKALASQLDPKTGLPRYLLLDRTNQSTGGGYFEKRLFDYGTQNFEQESIDRFYTYAQRALYRKLAPHYRANPEMTVAVEPNHENEIVSGRKSVGDYHPKSLEGFYHYLIALYRDLDTINAKMGTAFSVDFFDAPRGLLRGDWDRYDPDNRLFREWVEYNRIQIYRRVGSSYREALLAGFPPELIKSHQIPDSYVFGSIVGISEGEVRISPIDWLLTTGAGFGFSRYGTYYDRKHNIGQGAHSSGFDGMLVGEYASLNPSPDKALAQLLYLRNRGVSALHVMWWPEDRDRGYNAAQATALRELIANHDEPKPGLAGGIQQVRAWQGEDTGYEIASLGTGPEHTGLLKSLRPDGSFEGTIYAVPFHAHVGIEPLRTEPSLSIGKKATKLAQTTELRQGALLEVAFQIGELAEAGSLRLALQHDGAELKDAAVSLNDLREGQRVRVVYKLPLILDQLTLTLASNSGTASLENLQVIRHQDQAINLTRGIMEGKRHQGGVTFALLPD